MAWAGITYVFSPSTVARSSEVNQNFSDLVTGLNKAMPSGGIILWSGAVGDIPAGWYLCNGANGTPDLRNRFIVGAGSSYSVGGSGGAATHLHGAGTFTVTLGTGMYANIGDENVPAPTSGQVYGVAGVTSESSSLPPYYALCYIMKS